MLVQPLLGRQPSCEAQINDNLVKHTLVGLPEGLPEADGRCAHGISLHEIAS